MLKEVLARSPRLVLERLGDDAAGSAGRSSTASIITFFRPAEFSERRARGEFLECFEVFGRGLLVRNAGKRSCPSTCGGKMGSLRD